ncbi:MAG TPA: LysR family transcriptional regulator [Blastocatellia bacterium]|nr:LysR family transcriptional regulator [Blastocatellia bacterium]
MDLHQLKVFHAIAETGSFTQASRKLHLSQSTVSQHIRQLEHELDSRLFARVGKRVLITEAGKVLLGYCEKILSDLRNAQMAIHELNGLQRGNVRFGSGATTLIYQLPPVLMAFKSEYPEINLVVMTDTTEAILAAIRAQQLDLGLVMLPVTSPELEVTPLCEEELLVAVHRSHPLARKHSLTVRDVATLSFILYEKKTIMRKLIDDFFTDLGVRPQIAMVMENIEVIKSLVGAGLGASVLPEHAAGHRSRDAEVHLMRVRGHPLRRQLGLVSLKSAPRPNTVHKLTRAILAEMSRS